MTETDTSRDVVEKIAGQFERKVKRKASKHAANSRYAKPDDRFNEIPSVLLALLARAEKAERVRDYYAEVMEQMDRTLSRSDAETPAPACDAKYPETDPQPDLSGTSEPQTAPVVTVQEAAKMLADAMERREWTFYPIEIPFNEKGYGPATVGVDAVGISYEVWEAVTLRSVSSHDTLPDAIIAALRALAEGDSHDRP